MADVAIKDKAVVTLDLADRVLISDNSDTWATKNVINVPALTAAQVAAAATGVPGLTSAGVVSNLAGTTVATLTGTAATLPGTLSTGLGASFGDNISTVGSAILIYNNVGKLFFGATADLVLTRGAANILEQRNSTNAQAFRVFNTWTDASNGEWGAMRWNSNVLEIGAYANGTGTVRAVTAVGAWTFGASLIVGAAKLTDFGSGQLGIGGAAADYFYASNAGFQICGARALNFGVTIGVPDVFVFRGAANTLEQRNSTSAQTFRVFGTWTDASNGRWLSIAMTTGGVASIAPTGNGTGASGNELHISGLPTSNPGPGILWNNAGTPAIGT